MGKGVWLCVILFTFVAQVAPSCGEEAEIVGWVEEKMHGSHDSEYVVVINSRQYQVPHQFWMQVDIGDLVKFDGYQWTIVRKKGT